MEGQFKAIVGAVDSPVMVLKRSRLAVLGVLAALLTSACVSNGSDPEPGQGTPDITPAFTTTTVLSGARPTTVTPTAKPTTTAAALPMPKGFPSTFPIPDGAVTGFYTGNSHLGFHLNVATPMSTDELVEFFTRELPESDWSLQSTDGGYGFVVGREDQWAIAGTDGQVFTLISGLYEGALRIDGRHVDVLLNPEVQPIDGQEPDLLPPPPTLPRPEPATGSAEYSRGRVFMSFSGEPVGFDGVVEAYRARGWDELSFQDDEVLRTAVGDLAGWRVVIRGVADVAGFFMEFENLELSYP